eukprot:GSMAST32.ASY1.ANO1.2785.1 assembled CDS
MLFHSQHKFSALLKVMPPLVRHCSGSSLQAGLVGLPNVGKSTLFNALTSSVNAQAANYPFCTIDANVGTVMVPDERLEKLAEINNIAGASEGEGMGNKFLADIRNCTALVHVVRCHVCFIFFQFRFFFRTKFC